MRQQTGASEHQQYSRQEQVSAVNTATGRSRSAPAIEQQAGAGQHQQYSRQEQILAPAIEQQAGADISASNTTTTRNRSAAQTAFRPAEQKNRLSLTPPIQQHTGIYQYTTPYHSAEQRRARKGGARGGKAGFVTPSAFPPRKPAHAKVSPRKGKSFTAKVSPPGKKLSVRRHRLSAQERPSDARHCTISGTIFSLFLSIIQLHVYYKEHTSKLLTLNSESVILWSS